MITVSSAEGHGSAFSFSLYLKACEQTETMAPKLTQEPLSVLLLDHQERSREALQNQLLAWGINVQSVSDCEQGRQRIGAGNVDLVLVDIGIPDPGYEAFARSLPAHFVGLLCLMTLTRPATGLASNGNPRTQPTPQSPSSK